MIQGGVLIIIQNLNITLIMETQLFRMLDFIAHKEFQLENIRQLLCEEVTFNLYNAFSYLTGEKGQETIYTYHLKSLLGKDINPIALESLVKFYSNNNLNLNLEQFTKIVLTREDQLLSKLTCERELVSMELPEYLVSYLQKLFLLEEQIHLQLKNLRKKKHKTEMQYLIKFKKDLYIDEELLKSQFAKYKTENNQKVQDLCCFISVQLALRYLKKGITKNQLVFSELSQLFVPQNCILIQNYLKIQENNFNNQVIKNKLRESSPLIHKQFKKLKKYNSKQHLDTTYCYRQRISVENHINRNKKLPSSQLVKAKIQSFSKYAQRKMKIFFRYLEKIIKLQAEINRIKKQNIYQQSHLLNDLYYEITSNDFMIPSQLRMYIQKAGFSIQLNSIFVFFKKYANSVTGRLSKKQFIKVFRPNHQKQLSQTKQPSLTLEDRRHFIKIMLSQIVLECKIQQYKMILYQKEIDMRQSFNLMDTDCKGKISKTDLQVAYVKIMREKLGNQELLVFWRRMGKKNAQEYLQYDIFMFQMLPKTRHNINNFKNSK